MKTPTKKENIKPFLKNLESHFKKPEITGSITYGFKGDPSLDGDSQVRIIALFPTEQKDAIDKILMSAIKRIDKLKDEKI